MRGGRILFRNSDNGLCRRSESRVPSSLHLHPFGDFRHGSLPPHVAPRQNCHCPRCRKRIDRRARLTLQELETRENPSAPAGLTDFSSLLGYSSAPTGYTETHSIARSEANTVTVDQAGTGSSGTFTITVDASNSSSDTATGSATGGNAITATGTGSIQSTLHQVLSGTFADGAFTITSETYSETGSYSSAVNTTTTYSYGSGTSTNESDSARSGTYSLSYTATAGSYGMLNYTSYDYTASDTAHSFSSYSGTGSLYEYTTDAAYTVHTTGSGWMASSTGTDATSGSMHMSYPNPGGTPYDYTSSYSSSNPISGTTYLMPQYESTYGMEWQAGTSTATGFTFHGVATQDSTLTESATSHPSTLGASVDVNSFASASHTSDSSHVVDDELGTPASGTGTASFHRDEQYTYVDDTTGGGSYLSGVANTTFHLAESVSVGLADSYTVSGSNPSFVQLNEVVSTSVIIDATESAGHLVVGQQETDFVDGQPVATSIQSYDITLPLVLGADPILPTPSRLGFQLKLVSQPPSGLFPQGYSRWVWVADPFSVTPPATPTTPGGPILPPGPIPPGQPTPRTPPVPRFTDFAQPPFDPFAIPRLNPGINPLPPAKRTYILPTTPHDPFRPDR